MKSPFHERVTLRPTERAEFRALTESFGPEPGDPARAAALGWRQRGRVRFFRHLGPAALLLPVGVATMLLAVLVWWPLGLAGAGLVLVGQIATIELIRARTVRRQLRNAPSTRRKKPC